MFKDSEEKHESFGMLGFNRVHCSHGQTLHGSNLKHTTIIEMKLYHGSKKRGINNDWFYATEHCATVSMSQNQFAELITTMNMGDGVPVTLTYTERDGKLKSPELKSVNEVHKKEFKKHTENVVKETEALINTMKQFFDVPGTIKKADRRYLIEQTERIMRDIVSNMPYMEKSFHTAMDKVVSDAKGSIEAFYQQRIVESGIEALNIRKPDLPTLPEN